jgi:hypothetical protein
VDVEVVEGEGDEGAGEGRNPPELLGSVKWFMVALCGR